MIRASILVPTYNRADYLEHSLRALINQTVEPAAYEILVIDNNSTDHTKQVVHRIMKDAHCRWSYLTENRQGLHYARNNGIVHAKGDIIIFGDDDIITDNSWLFHMINEFDKHPGTGIAGGKVIPLWNSQPEAWIYDYGNEYIHTVFAYLDYGNERLALEHEYVFGCNFAIRRTIAMTIGGSYPDTFPRSLKHLSGTGENAMIDNTRKLGYQIVYLPDAWVYHRADTSRVTLNYFIERHERWAIEDAFQAFRYMGKREAARYLVQLACERLFESRKDSENKINPEFYRIIHRCGAHQMLRQTFRVLTEDRLYEHITMDKYL